MLPKNIRKMRAEARKSHTAMMRVMKLLDNSLKSNNPDYICTASAFFQILKHHMEHGDLLPSNVSLATMLRGNGDDLINEKDP